MNKKLIIILVIVIVFGILRGLKPFMQAILCEAIEGRPLVSKNLSPDQKKIIWIESSEWLDTTIRIYEQSVGLFQRKKLIKPEWFTLKENDNIRNQFKIIWSKDSNFFSFWLDSEKVFPLFAYDFSNPSRKISYYEPYYLLFDEKKSLNSKSDFILKLIAYKPEYVKGFFDLAVEVDDIEAIDRLVSLHYSGYKDFSKVPFNQLSGQERKVYTMQLEEAIHVCI